mmetsp:Transcript_122469/g.347233  ORF Transcript_122469/g.347233 Transcript_122469/m.347233 type:complete len:204 (+) Transcript_122469:948-1559(+)
MSFSATTPRFIRSQASCIISAALFDATPGTPGKLVRSNAAANCSAFSFISRALDVDASCRSEVMQATQLPYSSVAKCLNVASTRAIGWSASCRFTAPSSSMSSDFQSRPTSPLKPIFRRAFSSSVLESARFPDWSRIWRQPRIRLPPEAALTLLVNSRKAATCTWCTWRLRSLVRLASAFAASRPSAKQGSSTIFFLNPFHSR